MACAGEQGSLTVPTGFCLMAPALAHDLVSLSHAHSPGARHKTNSSSPLIRAFLRPLLSWQHSTPAIAIQSKLFLRGLLCPLLPGQSLGWGAPQSKPGSSWHMCRNSLGRRNNQICRCSSSEVCPRIGDILEGWSGGLDRDRVVHGKQTTMLQVSGQIGQTKVRRWRKQSRPGQMDLMMGWQRDQA